VLDEAATMSSLRGGDELDESGVEELEDKDHDGEDDDSGEELDKAVVMTSSGGGDELDKGRERACGMTMTIGMRKELDGEDGSTCMLLGVALPSRSVAVDLTTVYAFVAAKMV
jgi:hypothetical protein